MYIQAVRRDRPPGTAVRNRSAADVGRRRGRCLRSRETNRGGRCPRSPVPILTHQSSNPPTPPITGGGVEDSNNQIIIPAPKCRTPREGGAVGARRPPRRTTAPSPECRRTASVRPRSPLPEIIAPRLRDPRGVPGPRAQTAPSDGAKLLSSY